MTSTATARKITERDAARAALRELFPIGSTVSTKLLHVSRSGMLRSFAVLVSEAGEVRDVSRMVAEVIGAKIHKPTGGVAMGGYGMDQGYTLAYSLGRALYSDALEAERGIPAEGRPPFRCIGGHGAYCPSNDHTNERSRAPYVSDYSVNRVHSDAGYALSHRHI